MKKLIVIGIILLFLGIAFTPTIQSTVKASPEKEDKQTYPVTVISYNADGSKGKTTVFLSRIQLNQFNKETSGNLSIEEKLSVYKKYELIPQNETEEHLHSGMLSYAKNHGYLSQMAPSPKTFRLQHFVFGFFNSVDVVGFPIPFGTSIVGYFYKDKVVAHDFFDVFLGFCYGDFKGFITQYFRFTGILLLVGFIGYGIFEDEFWFWTIQYIGSAVFGGGLGK